MQKVKQTSRFKAQVHFTSPLCHCHYHIPLPYTNRSNTNPPRSLLTILSYIPPNRIFNPPPRAIAHLSASMRCSPFGDAAAAAAFVPVLVVRVTAGFAGRRGDILGLTVPSADDADERYISALRRGRCDTRKGLKVSIESAK